MTSDERIIEGTLYSVWLYYTIYGTAGYSVQWQLDESCCCKCDVGGRFVEFIQYSNCAMATIET